MCVWFWLTFILIGLMLLPFHELALPVVLVQHSYFLFVFNFQEGCFTVRINRKQVWDSFHAALLLPLQILILLMTDDLLCLHFFLSQHHLLLLLSCLGSHFDLEFVEAALHAALCELRWLFYEIEHLFVRLVVLWKRRMLRLLVSQLDLLRCVGDAIISLLLRLKVVLNLGCSLQFLSLWEEHLIDVVQNFNLLCLFLQLLGLLHVVCDDQLKELVLLVASLQARIPPVLDLIARPVRQVFCDFAPAGPMVQKMCHDHQIFLSRESFLRSGLELENVAITALLISTTRKVLSDPGPLLTPCALGTEHKKLILFLRPRNLALFLALSWRGPIIILKPTIGCYHEWTWLRALTTRRWSTSPPPEVVLVILITLVIESFILDIIGNLCLWGAAQGLVWVIGLVVFVRVLGSAWTEWLWVVDEIRCGFVNFIVLREVCFFFHSAVFEIKLLIKILIDSHRIVLYIKLIFLLTDLNKSSY